MEETIRELFIELRMLFDKKECSLLHKYRSLRSSFERVAREQMRNVSLQSTDLAARINYLAAQFSLNDSSRNALHTFRLTSNDVMNGRKEPLQDEFLRDIRSVANAYSVIFSTIVPKELREIFPGSVRKIPMKRPEKLLKRRVRVCFEYADEDFFYVHPVDEVVE